MHSLERVLLWVLVAVVCAACGVVTEALRSVGVPVGPSTVEAAANVDAAITSWLQNLIFMGIGAGTTEGTRAVHAVRKRRKAAKAAKTAGHGPPHPDPATNSAR